MANRTKVIYSLLNFIKYQCVLDEIKTLLARQGVCELVFELIEKYRNQVNDEESRTVMKMACDMIVIILTGGKINKTIFF
jgi:hypothetical protein